MYLNEKKLIHTDDRWLKEGLYLIWLLSDSSICLQQPSYLGVISAQLLRVFFAPFDAVLLNIRIPR